MHPVKLASLTFHHGRPSAQRKRREAATELSDGLFRIGNPVVRYRAVNNPWEEINNYPGSLFMSMTRIN